MLDEIELFASLSLQERQALSLFCQERVVNDGEVLFHQGEESTAMYVLKSGTMQAYVGEKVLWDIHPQEFFWEMAIYSFNKLRTASVRATSQSVVVVLLAFSIQELERTHPNIINKIKEVIQERNLLNKGK